MPNEFGDFQTPPDLSAEVWASLDTSGVDLFIEPTVGRGSFLATVPPNVGHVPWIALDINADYVAESASIATRRGLAADIYCGDAFDLHRRDFGVSGRTVLAIGNPPWVTNAGQRRMSSKNLPTKNNRFGLAGLDAMTGKANFDIAESILLGLLDGLRDAREARFAFLVKRSVALKMARDLLSADRVAYCSFAPIDAKKWFDASVDAGLFQFVVQPGAQKTATLELLDGLAGKPVREAGLVGSNFVLDVAAYQAGRHVEARDGGGYTWRQGVKHDAAKILELKRSADGRLVNGLGEVVDVEEDCLHPFYKSSDLAAGRAPTRLFPMYQHDLSGPFDDLEAHWPRLFAYLVAHRVPLNARGSSIYRSKPEFMLFGVGEYTLAPWKVAISGFYKRPHFAVIGPDEAGRAPVVDDTCYVLPFATESEASEVAGYLNGPDVQAFLSAVVDVTAKRPFTKDVLKRVAPLDGCNASDDQLSLSLPV